MIYAQIKQKLHRLWFAPLCLILVTVIGSTNVSLVGTQPAIAAPLVETPSPEPGVSSASVSSPAIMGGHKADAEEWPWQVAIVNPNKITSNFFDAQFCGGALIDYKRVLTATHCVIDFEAHRFPTKYTKIEVVAGLNDLGLPVNGYQQIVKSVALKAFLSPARDEDTTTFLYLPFRVVDNQPNYIEEMTSVFDHSNPNYTRVDNRIVMFNAGIFADDCESRNYDNQTVANCRGNIQSFADNADEFPHVFYNGHDGYDWAITGDALAAAYGRVDFVGHLSDSVKKCLGYIVIIDHENDYRTIYGHLEEGSSSLGQGQFVNAGDKIGKVGNTTDCGTSTGVHLHFQVEHWQWQNETWNVTDPFGWASTELDPLLRFNGESSQNLWVNYIPSSYEGAVGSPAAVPANGQYMGGALIVDAPPPPPPPIITPVPGDNTPPTASDYTASASGNTANLAVSNANDASGIREVRFSAKFDNRWVGIGNDTTAPYNLAWNMCNSGVPDGDVELGMEVWDNAGNVFIWSQHQPNPHINKSFNCNETQFEDGFHLYRNDGLDPNRDGGPCIVTQDAPSLGNYCRDHGYGDNWNDDVESIRTVGPYRAVLFKDDWYGGGEPLLVDFTAALADAWRNQASSIRIRRTDNPAFTLYSLGDYNGESWPSDRTIYDMGHWRWNDRAQSIRVYNGYGVIVCSDADFKNVCGRAVGPAEWSDINALAQGLRDGVSSVQVCLGTCPDAGPNPTLYDPINDQAIDVTQPVILSWGGELNQFFVELWGGELSGVQSYGWTNDVVWNVGILPESSNPYYWRVKGWRGYGETGWADGSFYVATPDTTPPTGTMTLPGRFGYRSGPTTGLVAEATDVGSGVDRVEFYAWLSDHWELLGSDTNSPYKYEWNITNVREGGLWVSANIVDKAGNNSGLIWDPDWIFFTIDHSPPSSSVLALPSVQSDPQFTVRWSGTDNYTPGDLILYSVQVQLDCTGDWIDWFYLNNLEGAAFTGEVGHTYCFRSRAQDLAGNTEDWPDTPDTSIDIALPQNVPPQAPMSLTVQSTTDHTITISWIDNSDNESGFNIYRWYGNTQQFLYLTSVPTDSVSFTHTNMECDSTQFYKVSAFNGYGESEQIGHIEAKTQPCQNGTVTNHCLETTTQAVTFYEHWKCYGLEMALSEPTESPSLEPPYDDLFSSVKVQPGWSVKVFSDANFTGASRCLNSDLDDFYYTGAMYDDGTTSLSDSISSFQAYGDANCNEITEPQIPTDLTPDFSVNQGGNYLLQWSPVVNSNNYRVEFVRLTEPQSTWYVDVNSSTYTATADAPGRYQWRVKAFSQSGGESEWSIPATFTVDESTVEQNLYLPLIEG